MVLRMQLLEALASDVRVDGRRGDAGVTEQQLHDAKIGTVVQQMRRKRVAEHMRRQRGARDAGARCITLDQCPERLPRQRGVTLRQKNILMR